MTPPHPTGSHAPATPDDDALPRSTWANGSAMMRDYYDNEWGIPVATEAGLYERVCLEGFQAGLSWATILARREAFRAAFAHFDPDEVSLFEEADVEKLVENAAIIRSRPKILAAIGNARATVQLRERASEDSGLRGFALPLWDGTSLEIPDGLPALIWSHAPESTPLPRTASEVPTQSAESAALSRELKRRGFRFVGPTTAFALMEAVGMVDTHWLGSHKRGASRVFSPEGRRHAFVDRSA